MSRCDQATVIEPQDLITVARWILHLANRGPGRLEFLREASHIFLELSGCDALELRICADDHSGGYRWQSSRTGEERFTPQSVLDPTVSGLPAPAHCAAPTGGVRHPEGIDPEDRLRYARVHGGVFRYPRGEFVDHIMFSRRRPTSSSRPRLRTRSPGSPHRG